MIRIALTGGIATGKSSAARLFENHGIPVLDADRVARQIVKPGTPGLDEIVREFGTEILNPDGTLAREVLRNIVVHDSSARRRLEAITHPRIQTDIAAWLTRQQENGRTMAIVEAALLVETGSYREYDLTVVVTCDSVKQNERLVARNGLSPADAAAWISTQMPLEAKIAVADHIIVNDGTRDELKAAVANLVKAWEIDRQ